MRMKIKKKEKFIEIQGNPLTLPPLQGAATRQRHGSPLPPALARTTVVGTLKHQSGYV